MEFTEGGGTIRWGGVTIAPVVDWAGEVGQAGRLLPDTTRTDWERQRSLLTSVGAWDPATDRRALSVHSWVLRIDGLTVVVDTGAGNGKTPYLDNLARAGVSPQEVDLVVNTHLHADHVGWNTRFDGVAWVPTFANARYVLPGPDVEFWDPANGGSPRLAEANRGVFEDSVRPVRGTRPHRDRVCWASTATA